MLRLEIMHPPCKNDSHTLRIEDNDIPQHGSTRILNPLKRVSKGATNYRMKSVIEKWKKGKSLKGKKPLQQFHDINPWTKQQCGVRIFKWIQDTKIWYVYVYLISLMVYNFIIHHHIWRLFNLVMPNHSHLLYYWLKYTFYT